MQVDLSSLPTGNYAYTIKAKFAGKERSTDGTLVHTNGIDSAFGRGWGLTGAQELFVAPDGSVTLVDGDGNHQHFDRTNLPPGQSQSCPGAVQDEIYTTLNRDTSTFYRLESGGYQRLMRDGSLYTFSAPSTDPSGRPVSGKLVSVKDKYGNETRYEYDASGRLQKIIDPAQLATRFSYSGDLISSIEDPAGRITKLTTRARISWASRIRTDRGAVLAMTNWATSPPRSTNSAAPSPWSTDSTAGRCQQRGPMVRRSVSCPGRSSH